MSLLNLWPTADEINRCIKPEAEGVHEAVLLAVHQPSPLTYRQLSSDPGVQTAKVQTTEDELYDYLTTANVPTGAHIVPITGASGVGKSHLVRVLAARLQPHADRYRVIRIPKSASLRRVVELILEPLSGERYELVKQDFEKALAEINVQDAVITFEAKLEIALKDLARSLTTQLRDDPANPVLRERLAHVRQLPTFLRDAAVVTHFREQVLTKVVQRAMAGQSGNTQGEGEDFTSDDFVLPDFIDLEKHASLAARQYYRLQLEPRDGYGRRVAADLMNGRVVDQATRELFKLHEAMGGMTLQDVILDIRRLLLKDGRELIILVEDFKALTGIQETLLNVLIQEGVRDGVSEFATMRSVIAVTDGYLTGKDTIATRAKREWVVESHLSNNEEVLQRTSRLVASYLNAARWGETELKRRYEQRNHLWARKDSWISPYHDSGDTEIDELTAFGSIDDIPLFPFTQSAIACLAEVTLRQGDALVFTPRFIIDHILRNLLLAGRDAFAENRFPPPGLDVPTNNSDVLQWLTAKPFPADQKRRYAAVISVWGNRPQTRTEIGRIPTGVFKAFNLPLPDVDLIQETPISTTDSPAAQTVTIESKDPSGPSPEERKYQEILESWIQKNERMPQSVASKIRNSLSGLINERVDWNAERCLKSQFTPNRISIPNSQGEGNIAEQALQIAQDNGDPTGRLRGELFALLRLHEINKRNPDYPEADEDLARVANLVTRLLPAARGLIRADIEDRLTAATYALVANSRLAGLNERGRTAMSLPPFLFGTARLKEKPAEFAPTAVKDWRIFQENALSIRSKLIQLVLSYCGCFQGAGDTVYGVDIARLLECLPDVNYVLKDDLFPQEIRTTVREISKDDRTFARSKKALEETLRIASTLKEELGDEFDKQKVADAIKEMAEKISDIGAWRNEEFGTLAAFKRLCEDFRSTALKESLSTLQASMTAGDQDQTRQISRLAQLDINPIVLAQRFVREARRVTVSAQKHVQLLESQSRDIDPVTQAQEIDATFDMLTADLASLETQGDQTCF
ncbi:protein DpdH [Caballeronia sp. Lep1P3]|uniref:protein DpdH n=1 Tax=Caballeronia sp. Lep1P3 TaxID=2878150 RepID=UPI001FCFCECF|nr:protein DpdH [Caballeronia sp. Lep1P3]